MKQLALIFLICFLPVIGFSQHPDWVNYTNGKNVRCILNDGGFLWIGTSGGLVRMEKSTGNCQYFTKTNSGIPNNFVSCLAIDLQGVLWMGTGGGLASYDGTTWNLYNDYLNPNHPDIAIQAIVCGQNGSIWVGGSKIYQHLNGVWTAYDSWVTSLYGSIESLVFDHNGVLYAGSESNGMSRFDGTTWTHYSTVNSDLLSERIHDLAVDSMNNVWACSWNCGGVGGLSKFDGTTFAITTYLHYTSIESVKIDSAGFIWFTERPTKLSRFDGTNVVSFDTINTQLLSTAEDFIIDGTDFWLGTMFHQGLQKFDGTFSTTVYDISQFDITQNPILDIAVDTNGVVWCTHNSGIEKIEQGIVTSYTAQNSGFPLPFVNSLSVAPNNHLWMGSIQGVVKFDGTTFTHYDSASYNLIGKRVIQQPVFDAAGNVYCLFMWFYDGNGTRTGGGIMKYDGNTWLKINLSAIPDTLIDYIAIDSQGKLWAAGRGVVEKYDPVSPVVFNSANSLITNNESFVGITCDGNNNVWLGTFFGKIFKIQNSQTPSVYNVTPCFTLPGMGDLIIAMDTDKNNNVWFGILEMCSDELLYMAKFDGQNFTYYNLFNSGLSREPNEIETKDNKIYIATPEGLVVYTDSTLTTSTTDFVIGRRDLIVSPNPTTGISNLSFYMNINSMAVLEISDVQGKCIHREPLKNLATGFNTIEFDFSKFPKGLYHVRVVTASGTLQSKVLTLGSR